ncbi:MAG: LacI family transcriptional regulator [Microbacteriaceae bacterium]|jgi:LacI family transcriptional regulator|nr:LacI family transcriptional regulator [Microbacteriaceae bacterium]
MGKPTISDVARLAGVSTATVSRALTGSLPVREHVKEQVQAAADSLGYAANSIARALRQERTTNVGMIVPDLSNPFFTLLVEGVEHRLQDLQISLLLCSSHGDVTIEAERLRSLQRSQVEVVLISPTHEFESAHALKTIARTVPLIQIDQFADGVETDWVGLDDALAMRTLIQHVVERGARTAAYIGGSATDSSARSRLDAARAECLRQGVALDERNVLLGSVTIAGGEAASQRLSESGALPDVVICGADVIAYGVLQGFDRLGIKVPADVMVTGFDDIAFSALTRLSLTTIRQPIDAIAEAAVSVVQNLMGDAPPRPPHRSVLQPELIVRDSTNRVA